MRVRFEKRANGCRRGIHSNNMATRDFHYNLEWRAIHQLLAGSKKIM